MKPVLVSGESMRPLLISGDLLMIEDVPTTIPFGSLVCISRQNGLKSVHRYLGKDRVKGDRLKYWDEFESIDGLVKCRIVGEVTIPLSGVTQRYLFGVLSNLNLRRFVLIHHLAALMIEIFGGLARDE